MTSETTIPRLLRTGGIALALTFAVASGLPAFAASDGGSESSGSSEVKCREGFTYNEQKKICERTQSLNDEQLIDQGRILALAGHYENALEALMAVRDRQNATVLTYIGYAKRKMGDVDEGIGWYYKALAIEPDNLNTNEYLGEGYVAAGRMDLAERQLAKLETLCGTDCEQYTALAAAIAGEPENWR